MFVRVFIGCLVFFLAGQAEGSTLVRPKDYAKEFSMLDRALDDAWPLEERRKLLEDFADRVGKPDSLENKLYPHPGLVDRLTQDVIQAGRDEGMQVQAIKAVDSMCVSFFNFADQGDGFSVEDELQSCKFAFTTMVQLDLVADEGPIGLYASKAVGMLTMYLVRNDASFHQRLQDAFSPRLDVIPERSGSLDN